jgi:hypothetical protein
MSVRALLAAACAALAASAPAADEVSALPGWSGKLVSRLWSGFLDGGSDEQDGVTYAKKQWYMAAECEAADPTACPVILFSNGGPGAPSTYGFFTELGPYKLSQESLGTSPPTLFRNPYAWTQLATVVIMNGPAPVGYSYCEPGGQGGSFTSCGSWNDTRTAIANVAMVASLFDAFPEFKSRDLFLVGESYAGVYLTQMTELLLASGGAPNMRGLMLIDACMGTEVLCGPGRGGPWPSLLFRAGMACMSLQTMDRIMSACPYTLLRDGPMDAATPECRAAVAQADADCPTSSFGAEGCKLHAGRGPRAPRMATRPSSHPHIFLLRHPPQTTTSCVSYSTQRLLREPRACDSRPHPSSSAASSSFRPFPHPPSPARTSARPTP